MTNTYKLTSISDLMNIPDDRLDDCLDELKIAIRGMRLIRAAEIEKLASIIGRTTVSEYAINAITTLRFPSTTWVDNKSSYVKVNIKSRREEDLDEVVTITLQEHVA